MIPFSETQRRKEKAKRYVDRVIDQMAKADPGLKAVIKSNACDLIHVCMGYSELGKNFHFAANPRLEQSVNAVLDKLRQDIFNIIYTRCEHVNGLAFEKEEKEKSDKFLLLFMATPAFGLTLNDRIDKYVSSLRCEIEAYIAVGLANGYSRTQILNMYIAYLKNPYAAPMLLQAFRQKGFKAERIINKGISFGVGKYVSAYNNLHRLYQQTVFQAYNYTVNSLWLTDINIVGWYTVRGGSYPCGICDYNVGVFHPKDEFFYGYHIRCCCIMLPVYLTDTI